MSASPAAVASAEPHPTPPGPGRPSLRTDAPLLLALLLVLGASLAAYERVFALPTWRTSAAAGALGAVLLAAAVRWLRGGAALSALVSVLGLAALVTVAYLPVDGWLPDGRTWAALQSLLAEAGEQVEQQPAPSPPLRGLVLLVTLGAWVVGHAAHELLLRLRRPGLSLVPPLVLWTVPLAVPQPEAAAWPVTVPLLLAAGLVLLLGADARAVEEGRSPRLPGSGLVVGVLGLVAALLAPGLVPGFDAEGWVDLAPPRDPRGYQPIVDVSQRLQLPDERDVLRVVTDQRAYLRLAGLDTFDGGTWRLGPAGRESYRPDPSALHPGTDRLPPEVPAAQTSSIDADIEVLGLRNIYVPTPYQPVEVSGEAADEMVWSTEGGFLATWATEQQQAEAGLSVGVVPGLRYGVEAERPDPSAQALRQAEAEGEEREALTTLPGDYTAMAQAAQQVYAEAGAERDVDKALALQEHFAGDDADYTYSLDVDPLRSEQELTDFVVDDRVGYCEHFATAMAVMLRATGVPARVAVGFLPGRVTEPASERDDGRTEFTVATSDAHAWVEVYFPEHGWVTFEPTPRSDESQLQPSEQDLSPTDPASEEPEPDEPEDTDEPEGTDEPPQPEEPERDLPEGIDSATPDTTDGAGPALWPLAALAAALLLVAAAGLIWAVTAQRAVPSDPRRRILHAQRRLLRTAASLGLGPPRSATTAETLGGWRAAGRVDAGADRLTELVQQAAFGLRADPEAAAEAERLAADLARQLRASVGRTERWLAPARAVLGDARTAPSLLRRRA